MKSLTCVRSLVPFALLIGAVAAQDPDGELRTRVYDVRDLTRYEREFLPATAIEASFVPSGNEMYDDSGPAIELSDLTAVVQQGTSRTYWDREGVELRPEDSGFLAATCSADMHEEIAEMLAQVRALLFESVFVEVHELPASALAGRGAVLTVAEVESLMDEVGEHRVHCGRADLRKPLLLESKRTRNRIAGLVAKVAAEASAPEPVVDMDVYGASWTVRAMRSVGEALLVTVSGSERGLDPRAVTREVPTGAGDASASLDLLTTRIATCHASGYLQPGQALLVGSTASDGGVLCVRVSATGQRAGGRVGEVVAYAVGPLVRGAVGAADVRVPHEDQGLFPGEDDDPMPAVFDEGRLMEWITVQVAPDTWDGAPNTMNFRDGQLLVKADDAVQKLVAEQLRSLQALDSRQFGLEVRFGEVEAPTVRALRVTEPDQLAEVLQNRCLSVVSASRGTRLSATRHTPYVRGYDAVVASGSAVTVPEIGSFAQGFLLRCEVAPMGEDAVRLDLHLTMLSHDGDRSTFDLHNPRIGPVDRVDVRENKVRGATAVKLGEWTILHLAPIEGGREHVAVVARVRAL